jgi:hypothetical protein
MVELQDIPAPLQPASRSTTPSNSDVHPPPPPPPPRLQVPLNDRPIPRSGPSRRIPRSPANQASVVSKINLLDLAPEVTAVIFRYAHKPKDFHFLLPSGAGPLISRKYNLPLTVSKEWYRRVLPIYYETLRLTWLKLPDFVENIQQYDGLARYVQSVHIRIIGKSFYKVVRSHEARNGQPGQKLSGAQLWLLVGQYIDSPLTTFALCLDWLVCLTDLTLRFTDCKGGEVSLQSMPWSLWTRLIIAIASIIANLPESVQNLYLDCATVAKQTAMNPYPVHICPLIRKHGKNLKSLFLSCRFLVYPFPRTTDLIIVSRSLSSRLGAKLAAARRFIILNVFISLHAILS